MNTNTIAIWVLVFTLGSVAVAGQCTTLELENEISTCEDLQDRLNSDYVEAADRSRSFGEYQELREIYDEAFDSLEDEMGL